MQAKSLQSCPTLCNLVDCSPPGSSVHGILQARILEWIAISFFTHIGRWVLFHWCHLGSPNIVQAAVLSRSAVSYSLQPVDCNLPASSVPGDSPGKNPGVGCHALLQGVFPTQGSTPGSQHCRRILYHLRHQESPIQCKCQWTVVSMQRIEVLLFGTFWNFSPNYFLFIIGWIHDAEPVDVESLDMKCWLYWEIKCINILS